MKRLITLAALFGLSLGMLVGQHQPAAAASGGPICTEANFCKYIETSQDGSNVPLEAYFHASDTIGATEQLQVRIGMEAAFAIDDPYVDTVVPFCEQHGATSCEISWPFDNTVSPYGQVALWMVVPGPTTPPGDEFPDGSYEELLLFNSNACAGGCTAQDFSTWSPTFELSSIGPTHERSWCVVRGDWPEPPSVFSHTHDSVLCRFTPFGQNEWPEKFWLYLEVYPDHPDAWQFSPGVYSHMITTQ